MAPKLFSFQFIAMKTATPFSSLITESMRMGLLCVILTYVKTKSL